MDGEGTSVDAVDVDDDADDDNDDATGIDDNVDSKKEEY